MLFSLEKTLEFSENINYKVILVLLQIYDLSRAQIICDYGMVGISKYATIYGGKTFRKILLLQIHKKMLKTDWRIWNKSAFIPMQRFTFSQEFHLKRWSLQRLNTWHLQIKAAGYEESLKTNQFSNTFYYGCQKSNDAG